MFACELPVGSEHAASGAKQQATVKCVCVYVCMCVCVYVCMYVYVCAHAHGLMCPDKPERVVRGAVW